MDIAWREAEDEQMGSDGVGDEWEEGAREGRERDEKGRRRGHTMTHPSSGEGIVPLAPRCPMHLSHLHSNYLTLPPTLRRSYTALRHSVVSGITG